MFVVKPTSKNIQKVEELNDLMMDYCHHFITDDEYEKEYNNIVEKYGEWDDLE